MRTFAIQKHVMEQKNFDPDGVGVDNGTYFMNQDGSNRVPLGHLFELYRYGDSYIIYGELDIIRVEANFETSWVFSGSEIFVTMDDQAPFEMSNDRIILRNSQRVQCYSSQFGINR